MMASRNERRQEDKLIGAFVRALDERQPRQQLSVEQREQALQAALHTVERGPEMAAPPAKSAYPWLFAAAAALMLVAGASLALLPQATQQTAQAPSRSSTRAQHALAPGAEANAGPARLRAIEQSVVLIAPQQQVVRLESGRVRFAVEPSRAAPFRVTTDDFVVEVVGTEFTVYRAGVTVHEGVVQVLASDGSVLARLAAGQSWERQPAPTAATPAAPNTPSRQPQSSPAADVQPPAERAKPRASVSVLLAQARARVASRDAAHARSLIAAVLKQHPTPSERAEAETLLAECALVEGRTAAAVSSYERIAEQETDRTAAENALFAAGRLAADSGDTAGARRLLQRYLQRYPQGRFRSEAAGRLNELSTRR